LAKRGPKATPFKVLQDRKSWRAKSRSGGETSDHKRPPCPQRFITHRKEPDAEAVRRVARTTWDSLAPALHADGLLVMKFRESFACLCDSYGRYVLACQKCDTEGMTIKTDTGYLMQSPWVSIRNKMFDQLFKAAACFGLTPADIAGVRATEKPLEDAGKSKFFGKVG